MGERKDIRPPKFADKFFHLDFESSPMPVICLYPNPKPIALGNLQIGVCGLEQPPRMVSGAQIAELEQVKLKTPLICQIFNWSEPIEWEGIRLREFLDYFKIETHPDGYYAVYSEDGVFFETLSADEARDDRVLLAYRMNGSPLPSVHGGPLRLVVPFLQGYKSVKWVNSIRAFRNDPIGIKRLLGQSVSGQLNEDWTSAYGIVRPSGKAGAPALFAPLPSHPLISPPEAALPVDDSVTGLLDPLVGFYSASEFAASESVEAATGTRAGMKQILAFLRPGKQYITRQALEVAGIVAYTKFSVLGRGHQRGLRFPSSEHGEAAVQFLPKQCFSIIVAESQVGPAIEAIQKVNRTGQGEHGDGKIFVLDVIEAVRISTDERGLWAM